MGYFFSFPFSRVPGIWLGRNAISMVCLGTLISETEVQCTILINTAPWRGNYARIQTFIRCLGVPFLQGLQVFLLTLVNTESFPRTLVLISRLNHMP